MDKYGTVQRSTAVVNGKFIGNDIYLLMVRRSLPNLYLNFGQYDFYLLEGSKKPILLQKAVVPSRNTMLERDSTYINEVTFKDNQLLFHGVYGCNREVYVVYSLTDKQFRNYYRERSDCNTDRPGSWKWLWQGTE